MTLRVLVLSALVAASSGVAAQEAATDRPLSVIDWLGTRTPAPAGTAVPLAEPPVATSGSVPAVSVQALGSGSARQIGLVPPAVTGLPPDPWRGSDAAQVSQKLANLKEPRLPAAQALLYTVLLAEAGAPGGEAAAGDALALARVRTLVRMGALDPALALVEQAGVATSPAHFALWMDIALLTGQEDRACLTLQKAPHLSADYATRIFCDARVGAWEDAALTFGSAQALGLMDADRLALLDRFLNPDLFEDAAPLPPPRQMDPLVFRLFETIGESLPTGRLPRPYAVADLRDIAGWKAQLEAGERLTRAGALPDNRLLGLYTEHKPAASGGIWDRADALQRFDTALATGSADAVAKTLPPAWEAMREAELEPAFAALFADPLAALTLEGPAARIAFEAGLLSARYEDTAAAAPDLPETALLRDVAAGEPSVARPQETRAEAVWEAFTGAAPRDDLVALSREGRLGESLLALVAMLEEGASGDALALRDALATLRALGLEDTARRAALQVLLLER